MRDATISICKAIAIILMVAGHSECPKMLSRFLYEFHMPLFFITSGYFFSMKYLTDEAIFVKKKIKGIYLPFVKWSVVFLLLHNLMFEAGILNEQYGNISGGVTHPYTWHQIEQNFWNIITFMSGYDEFLAGAFWFFRALLVGSILYLALFKIVAKIFQRFSKTTPLTQQQTTSIAITVCMIVLALCAWKTSERLTIHSVAQGGYRDLMGCFFFGCGHLMRGRIEKVLPEWKLTAVFFIIVMIFALYAPSNMAWNATFDQFIKLPLPALCGFALTYSISRIINNHDNIVRRFLIFCGNYTLYILVFNVISFKLVSIIKIAYYDLDWQQIGCHMVIHDYASTDCFWIIYTIAGVTIPLAFRYIYIKFKSL